MRQTSCAWTALAAAVITVAALVVPASALASAEPRTGWRYTMVAFSSASDRVLDVYESSNGTDFTVLKKDAFRPPAGRVRDASLLRHTDGWYYITYTTADGANIGFARSRDRVNWDFLTNYPMPFCCALLPGTGDGKGLPAPFTSGSLGSKSWPSLTPFATKVWAPEWFVDGGKVHIIVSMSTGGGFVPYLMTARDQSLRTWSQPRPIEGLNADRIDTTIVKVGSAYHAIVKNETKKVVEHAVASRVGGPYRFVPPGDWGRLIEGPSLVQLPNGSWRLYFDAYTTGRYLYSDSDDGLRTWGPVTALPELSGTVRHVGILREAL